MVSNRKARAIVLMALVRRNMLNLLLKQPRVPATHDGIALIRTAIEERYKK